MIGVAGVNVELGGGGDSNDIGPGGGGWACDAVLLDVPGNTVGLESVRLGLSASNRVCELENGLCSLLISFRWQTSEAHVGGLPGKHFAIHALRAIEPATGMALTYQRAFYLQSSEYAALRRSEEVYRLLTVLFSASVFGTPSFLEVGD